MKPPTGKAKAGQLRQFKKIEVAKPKEITGGCSPVSDAEPDAPPC